MTNIKNNKNNTINRPIYGKTYSLTGDKNKKCISNGNSWKESRVKKLEELEKNNPSVPSAVYDIEASQEMADAYADMFGY